MFTDNFQWHSRITVTSKSVVILIFQIWCRSKIGDTGKCTEYIAQCFAMWKTDNTAD